MRELVLMIFCDACLANEVRTDATGTIEFTHERLALRYDYCDEHKNPAWSELREAANRDIDAPAVPRVGPRKRPGPPPNVACPWCNGIFGKGAGIHQHLRMAHGPDKYAEYRASHGTAPKPEPTPDDEQMWECDICQKRFDTQHGLIMHKNRGHGVPGTSHGAKARQAAKSPA